MTNDPINPEHYKRDGIEAIDVLSNELGSEAMIGYLKGNIFKYTFRVGSKGSYEEWLNDIDKAIWYLQRLRTELR